MAISVNAMLTTSGSDSGVTMTSLTTYVLLVFENITTNGTDIAALQYPAARAVAMFMIRYLFPLVVFVGTVGNALTAVVLIRQRMRATSLYAYLFALTIADTLVLYVSAFKTWFRLVTGIEWLHTSDAACRTLMYLFVVGLHLSAWLIVLVTLDRFIAVCLPLRAVLLCTVRRARVIIAILTVVTLVANSPVFWLIKLQQRGDLGDNETPTVNGSDSTTIAWTPTTADTTRPRSVAMAPELQCAPVPGHVFANETFNYIKFATYSLIPFAIVIILNTGIICRAIRIAPRLRRNFGGGTGSGSSKQTSRECAAATKTLAKSGLVLAALTSAGGQHNYVPKVGSNQSMRETSPGTTFSQGGPPPRVRDCDEKVEALVENGCGVSKPKTPQVAEQETGEMARPMTKNDGRRSSSQIGNKSNENGRCTAQARVTTMLLTVSFSWLALTTLFTIHSLLAINNKTPKSPDLNLLLKVTSFLLMYINHSINLFLYCLTGRRFRLEMQAISSCASDRRQSTTPAVGQPLIRGLRQHTSANVGRSLPKMTTLSTQTRPAQSSSTKSNRSN